MEKTWRTQDILIGLLAVLSVIGYVIAAAITHKVGFALDDSWIHQTYARNLAERGEWAFVPGETSMASTSPLYTILLAVGYILHLPFFVWTFALGALALAGAGWIGRRLGGILFPDLPYAGLLTGITLVLAWHLIWAAVSGMETMLFCTLTLAVIGLAWREMPQNNDSKDIRQTFGRGFVLGLVGAALTLTRPEGAGLVGLAGLFVLLAWPHERGGWRLFLVWGVGLALGWLLGVAPYVALNYNETGNLLPNTSAAKQAENAPRLEFSLLERYGRLLLVMSPGVQFLLLPGAVLAIYKVMQRLRQDRRVILFLLPLAWIMMELSAYALKLPAPYQHGRYVIPILPSILVYGVGGTLKIVQAGRFTVPSRVLTRTLGLSAIAVLLVFWGVGAKTYGADVRIINTEMVDTAHWVKGHLPPEELLAVHDIGALGYYAPRPIVDTAGLVTPEIVPLLRDHEAVMRFLCEQNAHYLMVLPDQLPTTTDDPRLGREPVFVTNAPYAPAAGSGNMTIYRLEWPDGCERP